MISHVLFGAFVLSLVFVTNACRQVGLGGEPVLWPNRARLGDTLALAVDSNYVPVFEELYERYNLSKDNVSIQVSVGSTVVASVVPRAVFDGFSTPTGLAGPAKPGAYISVVVFDLPTSMALTLPATTTVDLLIDGVKPVPAVATTLDITGTGGSPISFQESSRPEDLQPRPMLRLRGVSDPTGQNGFNPAWVIAGMEFTLEFPTTAVTSPDPFPATEAYRSGVVVGPQTVPGQVQIVLSNPAGFSLPEVPLSTGAKRAGEGPILDIVFTKLPGQAFQPNQFRIKGLRVTDRDGVRLTPNVGPDTDMTQFFTLTARKNLAE
jgi:hypothetical protein